MSKFCDQCGAEMDDNARFCGVCGNQFDQPAQPEQPAQPVQPPAQPVQTTQPEQPVEQTYGDYNQSEQNVTAQPYQNPYYYEQPVQSTFPPVAKTKTPGKGFGIASMILGIVALFNCIFLVVIDFSTISVNNYDYINSYTTSIANFGLFYAIVGYGIFIIILALLSLIFAIVSLVKGYKGMSIAGLILSILSVIVCIFSFVLAANLNKPSMYDMAHKNYNTFDSNFDDQLDEYEEQFRDFITDD